MTSPASLAAAAISDRSLSRLAQGMIGSEVLRIAAAFPSCGSRWSSSTAAS